MTFKTRLHDKPQTIQLAMYHVLFLFVSLWFFVPLENCSLIWKRQNYRGRAVPILGTHAYWVAMTRGSIYNGHLRGQETLIPVAEHLTLELTLPVLTRSVATGIRAPNFPHTRRTLDNGLCNRRDHQIGFNKKIRKVIPKIFISFFSKE